jgi:nitroimidazol reductase NimA-like FMN-containing flavoprotein (pyridoxamine 5'-phosphate oxidase superfamily)
MPKLTQDEVETFLREPGHLLRVATVDQDGTPRVVPVWYLFRDGEILFTPRGRSELKANVERDQRVGLCIDEEAAPYRKMTAQGSVRFVHQAGEERAWDDVYKAIATRYTPEPWADHYIESTMDQPRPLVALKLADARVKTWRMPGQDEHASGIWAKHYYVPGTPARERLQQFRPS